MLLGKLILSLGPRSSVITAKWYTIVFCTCDLASLIVQAIGGAKASEAETDADMLAGTHIMVAGIAFQLGTMTLFGGLMVDFFLRVRGEFREAVTRGMRMVFGAVLVSFAMIYVRSVYRTIELAQGWHGYLITHQGYFIGLDATIMVVAVAVFGLVDPALIFRNEGRAGFAKGTRGKGSKSGSASDEPYVELGVRDPPAGRF